MGENVQSLRKNYVQVNIYDTIGNFAFVQPPVFLSDTIFKSTTTDSVTFLFKNVIKTAPNDNKNNDTCHQVGGKRLKYCGIIPHRAGIGGKKEKDKRQRSGCLIYKK